MLAQTVLGGLAAGSLYALVALGLVLTYKTMKLVNFAQGELAMFSVFMTHLFISSAKLPYWVSVLATLALGYLISVLLYRVLINPLRSSDHLHQVLVTIGLFMVVNGVAGRVWGYDYRSFPEAWTGDAFAVGALSLGRHQFVVMAVTMVLLLGMYLLFRFTLIGIAMRAAAQDETASVLMGIRVGSLGALVWGIATVLGAGAGVMAAPTVFLHPNMMLEMLFKGLSGAVMGGFESPVGAVAGAVLLGVAENLIGVYLSPDLKPTLGLVLMMLILFVRPNGLLGMAERRRA